MAPHTNNRNAVVSAGKDVLVGIALGLGLLLLGAVTATVVNLTIVVALR